MANTEKQFLMDGEGASSPSAKENMLDDVEVAANGVVPRGTTAETFRVVWHIGNFQEGRKSKQHLAQHSFNITVGLSIGFPCAWKMYLTYVEETADDNTSTQSNPRGRIRVNRKLIGMPEFADRVYSECLVGIRTATMADYFSAEPVSGTVLDSQCYKDTIEVNVPSHSNERIMEKLAEDDSLTLRLCLTVYNIKETEELLKNVGNKTSWMEKIIRAFLDSSAALREYVRAHKVILFPSDRSSSTSEGIPEDVDSMMEKQLSASCEKSSSQIESSLEAPSDESLFENEHVEDDEPPFVLPEENVLEDLFIKVQRWLQGTAAGEQVETDRG